MNPQAADLVPLMDPNHSVRYLMKTDLTSYQVCQSATQLFLEKGFENVSMPEIAEKAAVSEAELYTCFGNKQDIVLFLYQRINADWQLIVNDIPEKKLADRFEKAMLAKIELMQPYADVLGNMMGLLLKNAKIGINAPRTSHIRAMGLQMMQKIIDDSADSTSLKKKIVQLPSMLYLMHWAILFLHVQSDDREKTLASVKLMAKMLRKANNLSFFLNLFPFLSDISEWADKLVNEATEANHPIDREILKIVFNNRKTSEAEKACLENKCGTCMKMQEVKINYFTTQNKPVHFILPAFPAKSPNHEKVLGILPDLGEEIALAALEDMCKEIKNVYAPGARITICSDGRIFSELVGVTDERVTNYVKGIKQLIEKLNLQFVEIVNLEDLMEGNSFDELRNKVLSTYAEPLEDLTSRLKSNVEFKNLFNGIHRFITDDRKILEPEKSATKVKEESKLIALKVIQHSNAWTRFLTNIYPDAVRLSIHPYPSHSDKIGIRLTKAMDNWLTPWHGVIVLEKEGYVLMKKNEAEEKGARLITANDQPYYYTLIPQP
jgi:pyoverdine/dityrosine biosynthesis protein Dit1/AcrR family transcriptional regulator